ncbi:MAG: glutathione ABC transporter substrate-binding protein [Fusobacteriaceae bacterium]
MKKLILTAITFSALFFSGCSEKKNKEQNSEKSDIKKEVRQELIIAQEGEPKTLDVHMGNDGFSLRINRQIYSRLVESDSQMKIYPGLAQSWKSLDDRTVQFKLRKGVKFHNGDEMKAEDVEFSFQRMTKSPRISFVLPPIERIDIVDDYTINMVTKTPFGPLLTHLSHPALGIVSKRHLTENEENSQKSPIGTGPYKFSEWRSGDRVILERNDNYFLEPPKFKTMVFRNIPEASSRTIALETGEVDIALGISSVDEDSIRNNPNLELLRKPSISLTYLGFNTEKAPFNDVRVRKAINYAVDKQSIIDVVLSGGGNIATSPIAPGVFGFTGKTKAYEYNLEKAQELLREAGLQNGFTTSINIMAGEAEKQTAQIIQSDLKKIGIQAEILVTESGAYWNLTSKGEHEMFLGGWGSVTGDADYGLYPMYHSKAAGAPGNRSFYHNEKVDELLERARTATDQEERKKLYEEIQLIILKDVPNVLFHYRALAVGIQKDIGGFNLYPIPLHDFYPVYIKP